MNNVSEFNERQCNGCGTCSLICPKKCIKMQENNRGFLVPNIDDEQCINCGLCKRNCPNNTEIIKNKVSKVYAAKSKDISNIKKSTSGGIFFEIASKFIENGIVIGASYDENMCVKHIIIKDKNDLNKIIGSKYSQSQVFQTFISIKEKLDENINVLYSGTGCQIAGLKKFLKKDYDNLYTVEVACHGVPSPGFFRTYLKYLENKHKTKIIDFKFRTKDRHKTGEHYMFNAIGNDKIIKGYANLDPYYNNFLKGISLRKSCYECKFKGIERVGDILLADYWGIEKCEPTFDSRNGASAVFICTEKGTKLFDNIKEKIDFIESDFDKATVYNQSIVVSAKELDSNELDKTIIIDDENSIGKIVIRKKMIKMIKNMIPEKIKRIIKKIR